MIISFSAYVINWFFILIESGIRGEVKVTVKVDFFVDSNKFRQSSCGVQFFYSEYLYIILNNTVYQFLYF